MPGNATTMQGTVRDTDAIELVKHFGQSWKIFVFTCAFAACLAGGVSLLLTKKYTAVCKIIVEPPAVSDPRAAQALSPIYLESLKTYQHFAESDSLFERALDHFGLREGNKMTVEGWKRTILKVEIPQNTKIVELSATLPDPNKAHAFALYLAQETVKLNRSLNREGDQELAQEAEKAFIEAAARLRKAEGDNRIAAIQQPTERIAEEIRSAEALRDSIQREILSAEMMIAEDVDREKAFAARGEGDSELQNVRTELRFTRTRVDNLHKRSEELMRQIAQLQSVFAERLAMRDNLQTELKDAQASFQATESRVRDIRGSLGYRGERLSIIDPGITPERPSSPKIMLNILGALIVALVFSFIYVTATFIVGQSKGMALPAAGQSHVV